MRPHASAQRCALTECVLVEDGGDGVCDSGGLLFQAGREESAARPLTLHTKTQLSSPHLAIPSRDGGMV